MEPVNTDQENKPEKADQKTEKIKPIRIITGKYKGRALKVSMPITRALTDRVKTNIFDLIQNYIPGAKVLDLYSGSGSFGLEALSRGSESCTFVETGTEPLANLEYNIAHCGAKPQSRVWSEDVLSAIKNPALKTDTFTLIFADPPFPDVTQELCAQLLKLSNPNNLFILRVPTDFWLDLEELGIDPNKVHTKELGISKVYFL